MAVKEPTGPVEMTGAATSKDCYLKDLHSQLKKLLDAEPAERPNVEMGMYAAA